MEISGSAKCQQRLRCKKSAEASAGPTLKQDDDNHVASGLPQYNHHHHAILQLSLTSLGDSWGRRLVIGHAGSRCLGVESRHLKWRWFGFRYRHRTFKTAVDAHIDDLSAATGDASCPRRRLCSRSHGLLALLEDTSKVEHLRGRCFGFKDRTRTFETAVDAHRDDLQSAPGSAAPPCRRRETASNRALDSRGAHMERERAG